MNNALTMFIYLEYLVITEKGTHYDDQYQLCFDGRTSSS
jgi:hypothetical protein